MYQRVSNTHTVEELQKNMYELQEKIQKGVGGEGDNQYN